MAEFYFGERSKLRIATCHEDLATVLHAAMATQILDFTVLCGHRATAEQQALYAQGRTRPGRIVTNADGVSSRSKHNEYAARAVDVAPWPVDWDDTPRFHRLAGVILAIAAAEGVAIRWGGDWDRDGDTTDHRLIDLPHFELIG